uniref:TPM domain-containing protein n=1 Tax=Pycnococcus provasolii TaxID=41880 RepID=A0A7S2AKD6_9CHLO|mmetsp:Transcript_12424/g.28188  ORF Transcript_12424/g.28188 Transcript_12424/m.28188 type:complete len:341 (+) Transcript_12424:326-1348(+)
MFHLHLFSFFFFFFFFFVFAYTMMISSRANPLNASITSSARGNASRVLKQPRASSSKKPNTLTRASSAHGSHEKSSTQKEETNFLSSFARKAAALSAATAITFGSVATPALADEFSILFNPKPEDSGIYVLDDAKVLKASRGAINEKLKKLHAKTGFDLFVVTTKKISTIPDPYEFADKTLETWYPSLELGDRKGVLLIVTRNREGAITGGPAFMNALDPAILDTIMDTTIPTLTAEEKFNQAASNAVDRIAAFLEGEKDPGAAKQSNSSGGSQRAVLSEGGTGNLLGGAIGIAYVAFIFGLVGTRAFAAADASQMDEAKKARLAKNIEESKFVNPFRKR